MTIKKTLVEDFIEYLFPKGLMSARLMNILRGNFTAYYEYDPGYFVEDIQDIDLIRCRHAGKKTITEFNAIKEKYLQSAPKKEIVYVKEDEENADGSKILRRKYECFLSYDVFDALTAIYHEKHFVEKAIREKFERDGIPLAEMKSV